MRTLPPPRIVITVACAFFCSCTCFIRIVTSITRITRITVTCTIGINTLTIVWFGIARIIFVSITLISICIPIARTIVWFGTARMTSTSITC